MTYVNLNGLTYHYLRQGSGPLLLLLHGFTGSAANWRDLLPHFAQQFDVLALDLPGHGRTDALPDPARYEMPAVAADIITLLDSIQPEQAFLLGYSMGGRLALYLAVHHPQRFAALVLESASPGLATAEERAQRRAQDERMAAQIEEEGISAFVARWERLPLFATQQQLPAALQERHRRIRLQNRPPGLANSLRGMGTGRQPSLWPHLPRLQLPVLLLAGAKDSKFVAIGREMAAHLPQAQLTILPDAGHTIHLEQPRSYRQLVIDWLAGQ